jgi:hypothetical protein
MEQEQTLNPSESLSLISEVISKTKENIGGQSFRYLLWGWIITAATILSFLLLKLTGTLLYFLPFPLLSIAGLFINYLYYIKQKTKREPETYLVYFINRMWLVLGLSFFLIAFLSVAQGISPFTYTITLAGIGTLISGIVMKYKPLLFGGFVFFIFAVMSLYVSLEYKILLQGVAILLGNLLPGYALKYATAKSRQ